MVRENGSDHEIELCQVDSNPQKVAEAVAMKLLRPGRQYRIRKYMDSHRRKRRSIKHSVHQCGRTAGNAGTILSNMRKDQHE